MRKKELLSIKKLLATDRMIETAENDTVITEERKSEYSTYTYEVRKRTYARYFMAELNGDVLKVAIFSSEKLANAEREPVYEVYINRAENSYITYQPQEEKWRTAKIDMLDYKWIYQMRTEKEWQTERTRNIVNQYFETGKNFNVYQAVLNFQYEVKKEERCKKYRCEIEQIDATMKEVPDLPKGFDEWVIKNCFQETLFYQREKPHQWAKVYCTRCKNCMDAPGKPEHLKNIKCPKCGAKAEYRAWNKQKQISKQTEVAILQRLNDRSGYILRGFTCRLERTHEKGWENAEFWKAEDRRTRLKLDFAEQEKFEYGEYKHTGVNRWCHNIPHGYYGYYYSGMSRIQMYTANLKRELKDRRFKNLNLKRIFKGGEKESVNPVFLLQRLEKYPFVEYLQKSGLNSLNEEIMNASEKQSLFDNGKEKINEVLMLDKQRFQRLRKWDGNCDVLQALQHEQVMGGKLTDKNIRYIQEKRVNISDVEVFINRTGMNIQRMLNYMERQQAVNDMKFSELKTYYRDYLNMAEERGMNITDEIVCKQTRMMEFHDRYLAAKNRMESKKRDKEVDKKFQAIKENHQKNEEHFSFETKDYIVLIPKCASDITKEGRRQHHCVGSSDTYMHSMANEKTFILFLRRKARPMMPYYTIEADWEGKVVQAYGAYDRKPNWAEVEKVLQKWTKKIEKRERDLQKSKKELAGAMRIQAAM